MPATFYRLHWDGRNATGDLAFTADNAYSALWGSERLNGGSVACGECGGDGKNVHEFDDDGNPRDCRTCKGGGVEEVPRGYSACRTRDDLIRYAATHAIVSDTDDVAIFHGAEVGTGFDGEPLVVPTGLARWMTWAEFCTESETSR